MNLYNDYNTYLRERYGCRVYKIALDAGFSCPNRDGTKGAGGCLYCSDTGSRGAYTHPEDSLEEQLSSRIEYLKNVKRAEKFIAYFQAFTNTHASPRRLKAVYDTALGFKEIVGISIGTRPDCVDHEKLKLIASYRDRYDVWIEYGLQSTHDRTLKAINRGHSFSDLLSAYTITKELGISVCLHAILGLPGETHDDMMATARIVSDLSPDGIKIHLLHVLRGSGLEELYNHGKIRLLEQAEYVDLVCDFLERLSPEIVIQRLTGEGQRHNHIAPAWALDKTATIEKIRETLRGRNSYQGKNVKRQNITKS